MFRESKAGALPGAFMVLVLGAGVVALLMWVIDAARTGNGWALLGAVLLLVLDLVAFVGFAIVNPNEGQAVLLLGNYAGTLREPGFCVSLRVRNFESARLKVNDHDGNPIEIAAIIVWKVVDTAEALFHVDNYENFLKV